MGCVSTKADINDTHPNIFEVTDEAYTPLGQLELKDTELVLYQRGRNSIHWPLHSIRKYGFDTDVFSLECGRRCPLGPGVYSFKCERAEQLFNLVQQYIQLRNIHDARNEFPMPLISMPSHVQQRPSHPASESTGTTGLVSNGGVMRSYTNVSRPGSLNGSNGPNSPSTPPVLSPPPYILLSEHNNNTQNGLLPVPEHPYINLSSETALPTNEPSGSASQSDPGSPENHCYMNVNTNNAKDFLPNYTLPNDEAYGLPAASAFDFEDTKRTYANIDLNGTECLRQAFETAPVLSPHLPDTPTYVTVREVNYAELDLMPSTKSGGEQVTVPDSPTKPQPNKSYVTIDFKKTNALLQSINPSIDVEEGSRKTRHNSTISDITMKNGNSISD